MEVNNAGKSKISVDANGAKTTFDRFCKAEADSYYSPYKFQNDISGDGGQLPQPFTTDFSLREDPPLPYNSWTVQDDPYQLMNCAQGIHKRNLADASDCGSETDLYGLVSNILEEVDPMDCYLLDEKSSGLKTVWSPKYMKEDNLQYLNSEVKMQSSPGMQSNHLCPEPMDRKSNQNTDIYQHFNSFDVADSSWLFSACNGESEEAYSPGVQDFTRPPPGLSIPPAVNTYIPKSRAGKSEHGMPVPGKDSSFCSTRDAVHGNMNALNDSCWPPNEMNDSYFSPYQDVSVLNRHKSHRMPVAMQDADRLASNIQALLVGEQEGVYKRDSAQNNFMRVQDDKTFDLKRQQFQKMSALVAQMPSLKKDMIGCLGEHRGSDIGKSQPLQSDFTIKEFSGFGQLSDYFEPPKSFSSPFNPSTPQQSTDTRQRETRPPQTSQHQHHNHHGQPSQYQSQTKLPAKAIINSHYRGIPELMSHSVAEFVPVLSSQQKPTGKDFSEFGQGVGVSLQERMGQTGLGLGLESLRNMAGRGDEGNFSVQPGSNSRLQGSPATGFTSDGRKSQKFGVKSKPIANFPREAVKKQGLLQNPYQVLGTIYAGQARHNGTGSSQAKPVPPQMLPFLYKMGDPRQNPCHLFTSHPMLPFGNSMPLMEMNDLLPNGEIPFLNPFLQGLIGPNAAGADFPGFLSTMRSTKFSKSQGAPLSQLHQYLEECYEQWRMLEKERKKAESFLVKCYPGKRVSVVSNNSLPKMPPNPSRVDRLIVDQLREQAKVVSLLGKMECLRSFPLHANICSALDRHLEAIHITQARRKDEFLNSSSRQRQGSAYHREDRETILLTSALKDLSSSTRKSRSALWCALQMTLPKNGASPVGGGERDTCSSVGQHSPDLFSPERAVHTL